MLSDPTSKATDLIQQLSSLEKLWCRCCRREEHSSHDDHEFLSFDSFDPFHAYFGALWGTCVGHLTPTQHEFKSLSKRNSLQTLQQKWFHCCFWHICFHVSGWNIEPLINFIGTLKGLGHGLYLDSRTNNKSNTKWSASPWQLQTWGMHQHWATRICFLRSKGVGNKCDRNDH